MAVATRQVMESVNPATEEVLGHYPTFSRDQVDRALDRAHEAFLSWRDVSFEHRAELMHRAAAHLRSNRGRLAGLITAEMGKPIVEAEAEIDKCAWNCDFYADHAAGFLAAEPRPSNATESYVAFEPLGTVLAVMPWNFPFWQVFRFAAPALMAGNTAVLKHASNVPGCALALEAVFKAAGYPRGAFQTLLITGARADEVIADPRIAAVTLTGSEAAGRQVAAAAGKALKKVVLELGGSDPFVVLEDADLDQAARVGARARNQNSGQSCIAAKRFIVVEAVAEAFLQRLTEAVSALKVGDPTDPSTNVGPLARLDLLESLDRQVRESQVAGAKLALGGRRLPRHGYFYAPTILAGVIPGMPAFDEETFGPAAAVVRARDEGEALALANRSRYGLGASVWTRDVARAKRLARRIEAGFVAINGMVASDPRLPFGGVKASGYGRELSEFGIREFTNIQTLWVGPPAPQQPKPAE